MKKLFLFSVVLLLFTLQSAISQIKVNSTGFVGVNNSSPSNNLDIKGTQQIITDFDNDWGLKIDNSFHVYASYYGSAFYPVNGGPSSLGKSDAFFVYQ